MSILYFESMHCAANFTPICNSVTCQSIVLESYPNPQDSVNLVCNEKNFWFWVFCG